MAKEQLVRYKGCVSVIHMARTQSSGGSKVQMGRDTEEQPVQPVRFNQYVLTVWDIRLS